MLIMVREPRFFYVYLATVMMAAWAGKPKQAKGGEAESAESAPAEVLQKAFLSNKQAPPTMFIDFVARLLILWFIQAICIHFW